MLFVWVAFQLWSAAHTSAPVSILLHVTILLLVCQVGDSQHQNIQSALPRSRVICYAGMHTCLHCSCHWLQFPTTPTLCDCFHDTTVRVLTPVDVALEIRPINPSKAMIQYSWFVVHYSMLLPDNLLDTTMTALRILIIFMTIIHELMMTNKNVGHTYTLQYMQCLSNHCRWVPCDVFVGRPNTQLPVECLFLHDMYWCIRVVINWIWI